MVLLGQLMELGSLGTTSGWPTFYVPSNTPIWALYNKHSLQIQISTGPEDQTPAFSQGILTSAYAWALHPILLGAPGDYTGQPLRQVPPPPPTHQHEAARWVITPLPTAVGYLSQLEVWIPKADEWVSHPPWRVIAFLHPEEMEACVPAS
jgi:hypothetical protein